MKTKISWNRYLSYCERLCPEDLSFNILCHTINFYRAYELGVSHRAVMCEVDHVNTCKHFTDWQGSERSDWVNKRIEELA